MFFEIVGLWSDDPGNIGDILLLKLPHQPSQLILSAARCEVISAHDEQKSFVLVQESAR